MFKTGIVMLAHLLSEQQLPSPKRDGVASALTARERPFDFSLFKVPPLTSSQLQVVFVMLCPPFCTIQDIYTIGTVRLTVYHPASVTFSSFLMCLPLPVRHQSSFLAHFRVLVSWFLVAKLSLCTRMENLVHRPIDEAIPPAGLTGFSN
jgi:hypothetical protein